MLRRGSWKVLTRTPMTGALVVVSWANAQVMNPSNGHLYTVTASGMSVQDGRLAAAAAGGYLVAINDAAEQAWILATFPSQTLWIGLSDEVTEGTFLWDSGEPFAFSAWCQGEPNNSNNGEDYVVFGSCVGGGWNDATCCCCPSPGFPGLIEVPGPPPVVNLGPGCGPAGNVPFLSSTPAMVGQPTTMAVGNFAMGWLFASPPVPAPLPLPGGCSWYMAPAPLLALASMTGFLPVTWSLTFMVPADPGLHGAVLRVQAAALVPGGPLGGLALTNGLELTVL